MSTSDTAALHSAALAISNQQLAGAPLRQICRLPQLAELAITDLLALPPARLRLLIPYLGKPQLQAIALAKPDAFPLIPTPFSGNQLAALKPWQIASLRPAQLAQLQPWTERLAPQQVALLTANQLVALIGNAGHWLGTQINAITPQVLAQLPVATLAMLSSALAELSCTLLPNGSADWHYLNAEQVRALSPAQLGALAGKGPISVAAVQALTAQQATALSCTFLHLLTDAMMAAFSSTTWQALSAEQLQAAWGAGPVTR